MSQIVTSPNPRAQFQSSGDNVSKHRDMIGSPVFERALHFALLQYQADLCQDDNNLNECAARHLRIRGAMEFVRVLRLLAETPTIPTVKRQDNLDHKA